MIVAAVSVHWPHGVFATSNGIEVPLLYGTGRGGVGVDGPGAYSVDALVGLTSYWTTLVALGRDRGWRHRRRHESGDASSGRTTSRGVNTDGIRPLHVRQSGSRSEDGPARHRAVRHRRRAGRAEGDRGNLPNEARPGLQPAGDRRQSAVYNRRFQSYAGRRTIQASAEKYRSGRNGGASKASCRVSGTWVRIPPSPP